MAQHGPALLIFAGADPLGTGPGGGRGLRGSARPAEHPGEGVVQDVDALLHEVLLDRHRGLELDDVAAGLLRGSVRGAEYPAHLQRVRGYLRRLIGGPLLGDLVLHQLEADEQAGTPHIAYGLVLALPPPEYLGGDRPEPCAPLRQLLIDDYVDDGPRRGAGHGALAVRVSVRPGPLLEHGTDLLGEDRRPYRHPSSETLSERHYVGLQADVVGGPHRPRPAQPCLYLVGYDQYVVPVTGLPDDLRIFLAGRDDMARCPHDGLQYERGHVVRRRVLYGVVQEVCAGHIAPGKVQPE